MTSAAEQMVHLGPGDHLCLIYDEGPAGQTRSLIPYIREGLHRGERCIYVADDQPVADVAETLRQGGMDVEVSVGSGSLLLWTRREWRQPGELDSEKKAAQFRAIIDEAKRSGFKGIRFAIEMTWTLNPEVDLERLTHWEATLNTLMTPPGLPVRMVCQYSRLRLPPQAIIAGLRTHPTAVIGGDVCPNHYYEAPTILNGCSPSLIADWMIDQLRQGRLAEKEREERIRAEAALAESELSRKKIEELYELARRTADDLREANQAKDSFLELVSHELRTPATSILGNAFVLRYRGYRLDEANRNQALADLHEEAKRLRTLIDDLLLLARVDGRLLARGGAVNIGQVVEETVEEHQPALESRQVSVRSEAGAALVSAQASYIKHVLGTFLNNAAKYSPANSPIEVKVTRDAEEVTVSVLDRGIGVTPEELRSLFTPFYRSPRVPAYGRGIGISLAACRQLIESLGGTVWGAAREGGGSEFAFTLPLIKSSVVSTVAGEADVSR